MSLVRWDPFRELDEFGDRLSQMFRKTSAGRWPSSEGKESLMMPDWTPPLDIVETPTELQIKVELPDMKKEDVKVSVQSRQLRIEGERSQEKEERDKKFHRVERCYGSFLRTFTLPDNVDDSKISADLKEGVMCIHLPKTEKSMSKVQDIKIN